MGIVSILQQAVQLHDGLALQMDAKLCVKAQLELCTCLVIVHAHW